VFTGIIEEVGTVAVAGSRMRIQCRRVLEDIQEGGSIAVNGVCLTAVGIQGDTQPDGFWCDLSPETLARTNLGALRDGSLVNLERPAAVGDRLSGHIVQGHVDGTAEFLALEPLPGGNWWLTVRIPRELDRYLIPKGSVTLDGVSLTIASLKGHLEGDIAAVAIIPHTYQNTVMREYRAGAAVNVEVDLIGKYVEKLLTVR
jgi:riboflavin synthase